VTGAPSRLSGSLHMAKADALTGRRWSPGDLSNATGLANAQKANASNRNRAADRMCKRDAYIFLGLSIEFFLENSAGELLRKARTTLLRRLLILAYSLVSVCPVWDTHAGRKGDAPDSDACVRLSFATMAHRARDLFRANRRRSFLDYLKIGWVNGPGTGPKWRRPAMRLSCRWGSLSAARR
jgi:hypothetical protein